MTTSEKLAPPLDPVLDDLYETRRRMLDDCGGSLDELVKRLRRKEAESGHPVAAVPIPDNPVDQAPA
jgi:hypothetical protein